MLRQDGKIEIYESPFINHLMKDFCINYLHKNNFLKIDENVGNPRSDLLIIHSYLIKNKFGRGHIPWVDKSNFIAVDKVLTMNPFIAANMR